VGCEVGDGVEGEVGAVFGAGAGDGVQASAGMDVGSGAGVIAGVISSRSSCSSESLN
jgi:hypothetical protein